MAGELLVELLVPSQVDAIQLLDPLPIPDVKREVRGNDLAKQLSHIGKLFQVTTLSQAENLILYIDL